MVVTGEVMMRLEMIKGRMMTESARIAINMSLIPQGAR
jgi:hypothetical protein